MNSMNSMPTHELGSIPTCELGSVPIYELGSQLLSQLKPKIRGGFILSYSFGQKRGMNDTK